jgi:pimeloyl-ACP methyl ester carboxylesterase
LFDDEPLPFTYTDPADPSLTMAVEVTANDMVDFIYGRQGDRISALSLPAVLMQLAQGGPELTAEVLGSIKAGDLLASRNAPANAMALLMHVPMVCSDDPVRSTDEVILDGAGAYATMFGEKTAEGYVQFCSLINVQELPDSTDVNVSTDVPVLLLTGDLDVATPTFRSQVVADALPNATMLVFPGRTHVQIAAANFCAADIMTQFVADPSATLDTSCVATAPVLGFVLPDGSMSKE